MAKNKTKITGWAAVYCTNGIVHIVIVTAETKELALDKFKIIECKILDEGHVRQICIVVAPGPLSVQLLPESDWKEKAKPIPL